MRFLSTLFNTRICPFQSVKLTWVVFLINFSIGKSRPSPLAYSIALRRTLWYLFNWCALPPLLYLPVLKYLINVRRAPRPRPPFIFPFIHGVCLLLNHPIAVWHILSQGYKFYLAKGYRVRPSHAPEYLVYASNSYRAVRSGIIDGSVPYSRYDFLEFHGENVNSSDEKLRLCGKLAGIVICKKKQQLELCLGLVQYLNASQASNLVVDGSPMHPYLTAHHALWSAENACQFIDLSSIKHLLCLTASPGTPGSFLELLPGRLCE